MEIMASYMLHRHGAKAMELYIAGPNGSDEEPLSDLVERTLDRRAFPLAGKALRASEATKAASIGP